MKLTPLQEAMLRRVVATNGGGISTYRMSGPDRGVVMRLHDKGLVQGKSGVLSTAVHTREGLEWVRAHAST